LADIKSVVGAAGWQDDLRALEPHVTEWRGLYTGSTPLLVAPATTAETAAVLSICAAHNIGVVPQGGNTGLAGGAIPGLGGRPEILLSASRMKQIRAIDAGNFSVTVEAGVILAELQAAVAAEGLYFPLSLAAEGSCQIGGNIATNAGGTNVLRYGNTRDLVLGLEVVLPDGQVWNGLSGLRKDNTGYDLKNLFVGSEGTLGFITAATLKVFPASRSRATAWLAVADADAAVALYGEARRCLGDEMVAFELIPERAVELVRAHIPGARVPLTEASAWHVLVEFTSAADQSALDQQLLDFLEVGLNTSSISDGAVAASDAQRDDFWRLRHGISEAQKIEGGSIKHDVSVPISQMAAFLAAADEQVAAAMPGIRPVPFGHLGDGNLHYNLSQPVAMETSEFLARWAEMNAVVHNLAIEFGGSFSAEHGIGYLKAGELQRLKDPVAMALMRAVKQAVDPQGIMNRGKVLAEPAKP